MAFWVASIILVLIFSAGVVAGEDMTDRIQYAEYWYQQEFLSSS